MIEIYGASDDLIEIRGDREEELTVHAATDILVGEYEAQQGRDAAGVLIRMEYAGDGTTGVWSARLAPLDEDVSIPWVITITARKHTIVVSVQCPPGTPVHWLPVTAHERPNGDAVWRALDWWDPT